MFPERSLKEKEGWGGDVTWCQSLTLTGRCCVTKLEQLVAVWHQVDGWRRQLAWEVHALWPCVHGMDRYHLGISIIHKGMPHMGSNAHQDVSVKLNQRCSSKTELSSSSCMLEPGCSTTSGDLPSNTGSRASTLENETVWRKCLALLMDGQAFLLWVLFSWSRVLSKPFSSLCR